MSLLNQINPYWIIGAQALGAPKVKKIGIEAIPMGYVIVEPGETAGWVGDDKLIPRKKPDIAVAYALAAEYLGMRLFYLEAGSGAEDIIPEKMIQKVKMLTNHIVVVGGIRTGKQLKKISGWCRHHCDGNSCGNYFKYKKRFLRLWKQLIPFN